MIYIGGVEKNLRFIYSFCYLDYTSYFVFVLFFFKCLELLFVIYSSSKLITA